jgi:hypothetical protein
MTTTTKISNLPPNALRYVMRAASRDETRFHLHGVSIEPGVMAATDGHRLHVVELDYDGPKLILPLDSLEIVLGWIGNSKVSPLIEVTKNEISIGDWHGRVVQPILDAAFPPWRQIVPPEEGEITVEVSALRAALKAVPPGKDTISPIAGDALAFVRFGGSLRAAYRRTIDAANQALPVDLAENTGVPDDAPVLISDNYLDDAIRGLPRNAMVTIQLGGDREPLVVRHEESHSMAVIMPMHYAANEIFLGLPPGREPRDSLRREDIRL